MIILYDIISSYIVWYSIIYKEDKENSIKITKELSKELLPETEIVEWYNKSSTKRKMEEKTYDILDSFKIPEDDISELSEKILQLLNKDNVWLQNSTMEIA